MIVTSLILVVISAVSLLIGGVFSDGLELIYVSIAAALLAGGFLVVAWVQGGRRRKPLRSAVLPGDDPAGRPATWQGASWAGAASTDDAPLTREPDTADTADAAPAVTDTQSLAPAPATTAPDDAVFAPPAAVPPAVSQPVAAAPPPVITPPATPPPAPSAPAGGWAPPPPPSSPASAPPAAPSNPAGRGTPPPPPPPA